MCGISCVVCGMSCVVCGMSYVVCGTCGMRRRSRGRVRVALTALRVRVVREVRLVGPEGSVYERRAAAVRRGALLLTPRLLVARHSLPLLLISLFSFPS